VTDDGSKTDLFYADDASGRQRWSLRPGPNHQWYNIVVGGGIRNNRAYLSVSSDGTKVDLFPSDDGSGRQRWVLERLPDGSARIRIFGGVVGPRRYLSVSSDGTKVDLFPMDDGSGRQRWKISASNSTAPPPAPASGVAVATAPKATESYPPPPAGVPSGLNGRHYTIDINGDWEGYYASPWAPTAIRIHADGQQISADLLHENLTPTGSQFFKGEFEPRSTNAHIQVMNLTGFAAAVGAPGQGTSPADFGLLDFDHVGIGTHKPFQRISLPSYNDIPCSSANEKKIGSEWAYMRAVVAQRANDMPAAVCWLYVASVQKNATAQLFLAYCLHDGLGTQPNAAQAMEWATLSASNGNERGAYMLAAMYGKGDGTPADAAKASYWKSQGDALRARKQKQAEAEKQQEQKQQAEVVKYTVLGALATAVFIGAMQPDRLCDYSNDTEAQKEAKQDELKRKGLECGSFTGQTMPNRGRY